MNKLENMYSGARNFLMIVAAYVLCHGATTFLVTPVQNLFAADITVFASLIYLPHGVRVLATWLSGWKTIVPLFAGGVLSELLFTPAYSSALTGPMFFGSNVVGAISACIGFIIVKSLGRDLYAF